MQSEEIQNNGFQERMEIVGNAEMKNEPAECRDSRWIWLFRSIFGKHRIPEQAETSAEGKEHQAVVAEDNCVSIPPPIKFLASERVFGTVCESDTR